MNQSDLVREITLEGSKVTVSIGDTVWWFAENQLNDTPSVGHIVRFCEDNMVDLVHTTGIGNRQITEQGVCLLSDPKLDNPNYRKRGSWCPRGLWSALKLR
jgi:hypothetical protein